MKKLLLIAMCLMSSVSYSLGFLNMSVEQIYSRGYALQATVGLDRGIALPKDSISKKFSDLDSTCTLNYLASGNNRIFKEGRTFSLGEIEYSAQSDKFITTLTSKDKTLTSIHIEIPRKSRYGGVTKYGINLSDIMKTCHSLNFNVIPNLELEEAYVGNESLDI